MIHSRPGFATRRNDSVPAKLNEDMKPALMRKHKEVKGPLEALLDARTATVMADRAKHAGPEVLVNPAPTDPPKVLEPGK
jgi:hypothetical protein